MHALPLSDLTLVLASLPAPYQLRSQRDDDDGFAAALYSSTRGDLRQMPAEPAVIEQLIAMQQRMQSHGYRQAYPHAVYLVLQHGDIPIGRLILDRQDQVLHLVDIAILPAAQGQGAGSAVLRGLQAQAGAEQWQIHLAVNKSNAAARALYQRLGFRLRGENEVQEQLEWSAP
ncbi:GNAT family N-acetyltransferase [Janthinobacterium lividum]|uniref:GNAT family N-acetyltransferase n=1 Tax=Janthinobacterium lividum TaxID=29581 RepID=A0ABU0XQL3_9BURK|nr:GNAT family N-acetyltransferase [Janthinobacterium lividum]MDQ4625817.1 GNAT family N-acetyltransferase [Janthinobacterium lividum]MDQ4672580.1 GNAT family N-acetyltransferase [Janthinobacterium lividum]MDQ4683308.1 GNAT family N-acetyltransferase [Janthinobacterium lividum]